MCAKSKKKYRYCTTCAYNVYFIFKPKENTETKKKGNIHLEKTTVRLLDICLLTVKNGRS